MTRRFRAISLAFPSWNSLGQIVGEDTVAANTYRRLLMNCATRIAFLASALLALGALGAAAQTGTTAYTAPVTRSAKVSLADLDLATEEGQSAARERLHQVARRLCSQVADSVSLAHQPNFVACVQDTLTAALRQVASPMFVAKRTEQSLPTATRP
jgi:UrcA family protein